MNLQWLIFAAILALCRRLLLRRRTRLKEVRATANRFRLQVGDEIGTARNTEYGIKAE